MLELAVAGGARSRIKPTPLGKPSIACPAIRTIMFAFRLRFRSHKPSTSDSLRP
jgi:hypothetical protein